MNKRYHNKNMKNKQQTAPRSKLENIGQLTGLLDCNGDEIRTGDRYCFRKTKGEDENGVVLWNRENGTYGLFYGCWYGDKNPMKADSYGKFIPIPADNGARMQLVPFISS